VWWRVSARLSTHSAERHLPALHPTGPNGAAVETSIELRKPADPEIEPNDKIRLGSRGSGFKSRRPN
jgi:hypothetical protein